MKELSITRKTIPAQNPASQKKNLAQGRVDKVKAQWKQLNSNVSLSRRQRSERKIESFIELAKSLAKDNPETLKNIRKVQIEFQRFQKTDNAVATLINMACNYVDLPESVLELTDIDICRDEYRLFSKK